MKHAVQSSFSTDTLWVLGGNGVSQGLGLIATVMLTNALGPTAYGRLALTLATMWIAAEITDVGMTVTAIRFGARRLKQSERDAHLLFRAALHVKLAAIIVVLIIGMAAARTLSAFFFRDPGGYLLFRVALAGAVGLSLWLYLASYLQAKRRFAHNALLNILIGGVRLTAVVLLIRHGAMTLIRGAWTYALSPFAALLFGLWMLWPVFSVDRRPERGIYRSLFGFGRWVLVVLGADMVYDRLDILMLSRMRGEHTVGIYAAAKRLALILPMIAGSLVTVLLPRVSQFEEDHEYRTYLRNALRLVIVWAPLTAGLLGLSGGLFRWVYRTDYAEGLGVFRWLIVILSLNILIQPIGLLLYARNRPKVQAFIRIAQLTLNIVGNGLLIPRYGAEGAALATLGSTLGGGVLTLVCVGRRSMGRQGLSSEGTKE